MLLGELTNEPVVAPEIPADADLASIIYTSGTTGRSKGVMLTHRNITFDADQCLNIQDVNLNDVFLSILPLSHTYENTISFILPIMQGSAIYYLEKPPTASVLIPALEKVRPTTMLSVPLVIEKIYRNQVRAKFTKTKMLKTMYENFTPFRKLAHFLAGINCVKLLADGFDFSALEAPNSTLLRNVSFAKHVSRMPLAMDLRKQHRWLQAPTRRKHFFRVLERFYPKCRLKSTIPIRVPA